MKIGYQGAIGSNAECAAREIAQKMSFQDVEFIPLVGSRNVIEELDTDRIDLGVVAVRNSIAGEVAETLEAIAGKQHKVLCEHDVYVHHYLFKMPHVDAQELTHVASHPQALAQTRKTRQKFLPQLEERPTPDTAISAAWLSSGVLPPTTAVLCRDNAGKMWGLELMGAAIEDEPGNHTTFQLLQAQED